MKSILTIAAVSLLALSAPAFAQSANAPGGSPGGSGQNPPGSGMTASPNGTDNGAMQNNGSMKMNEGRASQEAPVGDKADNNPRSVRSGQDGQGDVK